MGEDGLISLIFPINPYLASDLKVSLSTYFHEGEDSMLTKRVITIFNILDAKTRVVGELSLGILDKSTFGSMPPSNFLPCSHNLLDMEKLDPTRSRNFLT